MDATIGEVLGNKTSGVFYVAPETIIRDAVDEMNRHNIGAVLVMEDEQLIGLFSERDVLCRVVAKGIDPQSTAIAEVMTRKLCVVTPEHKVGQAMQILNDKGFRHLPVVENGKVVGVLSIRDLTQWVLRNQESRIDELVDYISGNYGA